MCLILLVASVAIVYVTFLTIPYAAYAIALIPELMINTSLFVNRMYLVV